MVWKATKDPIETPIRQPTRWLYTFTYNTNPNDPDVVPEELIIKFIAAFDDCIDSHVIRQQDQFDGL